MKISQFLLCFICAMFIFTCCKEENDDLKTGVQKNKFTGFVEKGPFITGSKITLSELDNGLNPTGKIYETIITNDEGFFNFGELTLSSPYVQLSVDGYCFNEVTGSLTSSPITLWALADITDKSSVNVNVLTHLEMKRVKYLVNNENLSFSKAKEQAEKEILHCFYIDNETILPENTSITDNNTSADILIAISVILLRNNTEAEYTEFINHLGEELVSNGSIGSEMKGKIAQASFELNYHQIKRNIIERYQELGKEISVGNFHYYIDYDGDGVLSPYNMPEDVTIHHLETEEEFENFTASTLILFNEYIQTLYLFQAFYTQNVVVDSYQIGYYAMKDIYEHKIHSDNGFIGLLYSNAYITINYSNAIIKYTSYLKKFQKYKFLSMMIRAYVYLSISELWGDIPLVLKPYETEIDASTITRTSKDQIINQLIADLQEIHQYMPEEERMSSFVFHKDMVSALLAKAFTIKEDYTQALKYAEEIINKQNYSLESEYNNIFIPGNQEVILFSETPINSGYKYHTSFEDYIQTETRIPLLRFSEILLIGSEASYELGNYDNAKKLLNRLRSRNQRNLLTNNNDWLEYFLEEWKNDLGKEGFYFSTLKRKGVAEKVLEIEPYQLLLPIPARELMYCSNMTQNPGY